MNALNGKKLRKLGMPAVQPWFNMTLTAINSAVAKGCDRELAIDTAEKLIAHPETFENQCPTQLKPFFEPLLEWFRFCNANRIPYRPRQRRNPWNRWGETAPDRQTHTQMENACKLPISAGGALLPDAYTDYGLPIGCVLAMRNAVIPFAVGVDIACRMRLTVLDLPPEELEKHEDRFIRAIENETAFGHGAVFPGERQRSHAVMDEDWRISPITMKMKEKAARQLGSSGRGNHFVEFGVLDVPEAAARWGFSLAAGKYLALLSHSGSRETGEVVARHYSELARNLHPEIPGNLAHLAWLELYSQEGQEYWNAMQLMGRYAYANHELIHGHVLRTLGAEALGMVENCHNFAWRETYNGEDLIIHRKGATSAWEGSTGIVPGSMCSRGFVVRGKGNPASWKSCAHGAGRRMSRAAAYRELGESHMREILAAHDVHLLSGTLGESPEAYKDIEKVMAYQTDLVDILATFMPRLVKMAPDAGSQRQAWRIEK